MLSFRSFLFSSTISFVSTLLACHIYEKKCRMIKKKLMVMNGLTMQWLIIIIMVRINSKLMCALLDHYHQHEHHIYILINSRTGIKKTNFFLGCFSISPHDAYNNFFFVVLDFLFSSLTKINHFNQKPIVVHYRRTHTRKQFLFLFSFSTNFFSSSFQFSY